MATAKGGSTFVEEPQHEISPEERSTAASPIDAVHNEKEVPVDPALGDMGSKWLAQYTGTKHSISDEESIAVQRRIDRFLMPVIFYVYFCQQLDKSAISFASIFGFSNDAHLVGQQYSWLGSIVYFAQLVFQPLSVYALVKFKVNHWILFCFFGWGASCMISAAFTSFAGIAVFRFILGAFEASISPTMLVVVAMWWTRREQVLRNNIWYSANGVATMLGSLIAFGLGHITDGALYRYQYIFIVTGAVAILCWFPTLYLFPAHPTTARWLNDEQKYIALERIRLNNTGTQNTHFKWGQVREAFLDPKSWGWVIMTFCISLVSGGIGTFGPLIIQGFGFDAYQTILFNMIPGPIQIAANIITALLVQYTKYKAPVLLGVTCFPIAAAAALYALPRGTQYTHQLLGVFYILQIFAPITSLIFSWTFANTAGHTKKTTTTGMLYIGLTVGNIVGPQLYKTSEKPYYHTGLTGNLVVLCVMFGVMILQAFYLHMLNRRNIKRRRAKGKTGAHVDYSLENSKKWKNLREKQINAEAAEGHLEHEEYNAHAFDDLTDLQNEDFVYSL